MGGIAFLNEIRKKTEIDWTFFSPAALIEDGPRMGIFRLGKDQLVVDLKGESRISFSDYAIAMVDELEQHRHPRALYCCLLGDAGGCHNRCAKRFGLNRFILIGPVA